MTEEVLLLGPHETLVGIHTPAASGVQDAAPRLVVIMLNSGLIHHVGPHRLYVKLARALAQRGIGAVRVDLSGIGDSPARPDNLPAAQQGFQEPREIVDSLRALGYQRFVLLGICSGAKHALQAVSRDAISGDARIEGLVLVNQEAMSEDTTASASATASAQFYLRRSLWNPRAWLNLLTGRVKYRALFNSLAGAIRRRLRGGRRVGAGLAEVFRTELEPALARQCSVLLMLSDRHAQYVGLFADGVQQLRALGRLHVEVCPNADHLFTTIKDQDLFVGTVCTWAEALRLALPEQLPAQSGSIDRSMDLPRRRQAPVARPEQESQS